MHTIITLPSGIRILQVAPKSATCAMVIGVVAGSRNESKMQFGMAHFIEHMFFKGTKKRPSYIDVSKDLDALGSHYNAFTSNEFTSFYVHSSCEKSLESAEILLDLFLNNTLPEEEIAKEKAVISEEINMYEDMPQAKATQEFQKLIFEGHSLAHSIPGEKTTIANFQKKDMQKFIKDNYMAPNIVVAIAGKVDKKLTDYIKEKLENYKNTDARKFVPQIIKPKKQIKTFQKNIDQAHIILGFPTFEISDPRRFTLQILENILGGMMSSRLFVEVREKRGLAYYVSSGSSLFLDNGYLAVRAGLNKNKLDDGIRAIRREIKKIASEKVLESELSRAKDNFIGQFSLGLESSLDIAQYYLGQELLQKEVLSPQQVIERIEKVSQNDIIKLAKQFFDFKKENLVIVK